MRPFLVQEGERCDCLERFAPQAGLAGLRQAIGTLGKKPIV